MAPAGGGMVTFSVQVANGGTEAITVTGLENDVFRNLMSPGGVPTRFLTMVPNGRLHNDMQSWLEAGSQPADPAWNDFLWMNLSMSPSRALGERGFVAFIPYLVTLLLVMGTAFYQQKQTTPKAKDGQPTPQQPGQAVLKIFPIFFGFISYGLPAGLGVYFAASSVFRIAQQDLIIRLGEREHDEKAKSEPVAELAEPAPKAPERPVRPAGVQPKSTSPAATTRSPQASQQTRQEAQKEMTPMEEWVEVRAKTVEEAIEEGLRALGLESREAAEIEVLREPQRGFLGFRGRAGPGADEGPAQAPPAPPDAWGRRGKSR